MPSAIRKGIVVDPSNESGIQPISNFLQRLTLITSRHIDGVNILVKHLEIDLLSLEPRGLVSNRLSSYGYGINPATKLDICTHFLQARVFASRSLRSNIQAFNNTGRFSCHDSWAANPITTGIRPSSPTTGGSLSCNTASTNSCISMTYESRYRSRKKCSGKAE